MASAWIAETLRVSLFSNENIQLSNRDWKAITGLDEPELEQKSRGALLVRGQFLGAQLDLVAKSNRLDCMLVPSRPSEEAAEDDVLAVGDWPDSCIKFAKATESWISEIESPIIRLAFGAILLSEEPDREAVYKSLVDSLVSVTADPSRMRDINYRINWPVESASVKGLSLNRLLNWSPIKILSRSFQPQDGTLAVEDLGERHYVRLEIDHNTDANHTEPFDQKIRGSIYKELISLALENAEKGEIV